MAASVKTMFLSLFLLVTRKSFNPTIQERLGRDIQALCAAINFSLKRQSLTKPTWIAQNTYPATKYLYLHSQLYIHLPKPDEIHLPAASEQEICILRTFGLIYDIGFYFHNIRGKAAERVGRQQKAWETIFWLKRNCKM